MIILIKTYKYSAKNSLPLPFSKYRDELNSFLHELADIPANYLRRISCAGRIRAARCAAAILLCMLPSGCNSIHEQKTDIAVFGATSSGILAAYSAAEEGASVILIANSKHLGGMLTGGLSNTDVGNSRTIGGATLKLFKDLKEHYQRKYVWKFEPKIASKLLQQLISSKQTDTPAPGKITLIENAELLSVNKTDTKISKLKLKTPQGLIALEAHTFIDSSYEGDLLAAAGVSYEIGREPRDKYQESLAGFVGTNPNQRSKKHGFGGLVTGRTSNGELLPYVSKYSQQKDGAGDNKLPAYTYRLCLTRNKTNLAPIPEPKNYQPALYELLGRYLEKKPDLRLKHVLVTSPIPGDKLETNSRGPVSTDFIGASWNYPEADSAQRMDIIEKHREYTKGFFLFLNTDSRVPKEIKNEVRKLGLCKDEFVETNNWPPQLYIRVARRMLGEFIMSEKDVRTNLKKADPVAIGSRPIELRHVQRIEIPTTEIVNEGHKTVFTAPYHIPYRSLLPRSSEASNLIVPVALSASYVAYNSIRMEPVYMMLGESAGVAAALAAKEKTTVQQVPYESLKNRLLKRGQILTLPK